MSKLGLPYVPSTLVWTNTPLSTQPTGWPQKKVYLFYGFPGEHGCLQNSKIDIFLDSQWKIRLFQTNSFKDFIVRKNIFVIAQYLAKLRNYKYLS